MASKNSTEHVTGYVKKGELVGRMSSNEYKYVMFPKTEIMTVNSEIISIDEDKPKKMLV